MERDLAAIALRSSASARGVLAQASKPARVIVKAAPRGRATGWSATCGDHGAMPVLAPTQASAVELARDHLKVGHRGRGEVLVDAGGKRPRRKPRRG